MISQFYESELKSPHKTNAELRSTVIDLSQFGPRPFPAVNRHAAVKLVGEQS